MSTFPYIQLSNVFNPDDFTAADSSLTIALGDERYVRIGSFGILAALNVSGNIDAGSLTINGSPIDIPSLDYITDITPGTVTASKALVVDANKDINSVRNMSVEGTFTILEGGAVDFQSSSTISYSGNGTHLVFSGANSYLSMEGANTRIQMDATNSYISLANTAKSTNSNTGCIRAAGGIYVGDDSIFAMDLNLTGHNGTTNGLHLGGTLVTATASELNYVDVAAGTASASKALVLDSSSNITGINSISVNSLNAIAGDIRLDDGYGIYFDRTVGSDINSSITCDSTANMTFTSGRGNGNFKFESNGLGSQIFSLNDASNANHTIIAFANKVGINKATSTTSLSYNLDVGGSINASSYYHGGTAVPVDYLTGVTAGTASASKALVLDSSSNITGINSLSSTYLVASNYLQSSGTTQPSLTETSLKSEYRLILSHNVAANGRKLGIAFDCNSDPTNLLTPGAAIVYNRTAAWGQGDLLFQTKGVSDAYGACSERMRIMSAGNVGIGTSAPAYKLDVSGSINGTSYYQGGSLLDFSALSSASSTLTSGALLKGDTDNSFLVSGSSDSGANNFISFYSKNYNKIYYDTTNNKVTNFGYLGHKFLSTYEGALGATHTPFTLVMEGSSYGDKTLDFKLTHSSDIGCLTTTGMTKLIIGLDNSTGTSNVRQFVLTGSVMGYNGAVPSGFDIAFNSESGTKIGTALAVGDSTDATRLISALDNTGTRKTISFGRSNSSKNCAEMTFEYTSSGSDDNRLSLGFNSAANKFNIFADGKCSIGSTVSYTPLYIATGTTLAFGSPSGTVYRLRTDYGITESASGPIFYSVSLHCNNYISATAMAMTSDSRLKQDIAPLDMNHINDFYKNITPVSYRWKPESNMPTNMPEVGVIAQNLVAEGYMDLVSATMNPGLAKSCPEDEDGVQLAVRYDRISVYNMKMIQSLMERINELEERVAYLNC